MCIKLEKYFVKVFIMVQIRSIEVVSSKVKFILGGIFEVSQSFSDEKPKVGNIFETHKIYKF